MATLARKQSSYGESEKSTQDPRSLTHLEDQFTSLLAPGSISGYEYGPKTCQESYPEETEGRLPLPFVEAPNCLSIVMAALRAHVLIRT